jgi:hypothetical protein
MHLFTCHLPLVDKYAALAALESGGSDGLLEAPCALPAEDTHGC